jgi:hypothetical protein
MCCVIFNDPPQLVNGQCFSLLVLRRLRRWPACSYEFAEVLRRRQTSVMVRPAVHDLAQLERTGKTRRISSYSELTNSAWTCRHSGEFALRDALVRLMPSASMS